MTVELVFRKLTIPDYSSCEAVCGFLRANRLRPCCGLCGSKKVSLVASRFLDQVLLRESSACIAATFNHLKEKEQDMVLKLLPGEQYAGLRERMKEIWSFTYLLQGAPAVSYNPSAMALKDPSIKQLVLWGGNKYADDMIHMDSLLSLIKPDAEVVRQQLVQFYNAVIDRYCTDFFSDSEDPLNECIKEFANNPHYKELWQFLSENAEHSAPELFATGLLNRPANQEKADPVLPSQEATQNVQSLKEQIDTCFHEELARKAAGPASVESTSAKPQGVLEKPCATLGPVVARKPTHYYNLRSRKSVV
jgi:hypothetical protein